MTIFNQTYPSLATVEVTDNYCYLNFNTPLNCISNAPFHGGVLAAAKGILNLNVSDNDQDDEIDSTGKSIEQSIKTTFVNILNQQKLAERSVGLMTAASMKSFRIQTSELEGYTLLCAVTAGLANARRIGDPADFSSLSETSLPDSALPAGTINIIFATNAPLSASAQQEAFALITEAKTAACYDANILSLKSKLIATGTGTDATVIASSPTELAQIEIPFCGKHTIMGEHIGRIAYGAVANAIQGCLDC